MTTRLERTLGFTFATPDLRRAACCHQSIYSVLEALERYGFDQESLALYGDRLAANFLSKYRREYPEQLLYPAKFLSNHYMAHYVHDQDWTRHLRYRFDPDSKKAEHEFGTFFEALLAARYLSVGFERSYRFFEGYVRDMTTFEYYERAHSVNYWSKWLRSEAGTNLSRLQRVLSKHSPKKTIKTVRLTRTGHAIKLTFTLPNFSGCLEERDYIGCGQALPQAIEKAAAKALREMERSYLH